MEDSEGLVSTDVFAAGALLNEDPLPPADPTTGLTSGFGSTRQFESPNGRVAENDVMLWDRLRALTEKPEPWSAVCFACLDFMMPDIICRTFCCACRGASKSVLFAANALPALANPTSFLNDAEDYWNSMFPNETVKDAIKFVNDGTNKPGHLTPHELIYTSRLSLVAYLNDNNEFAEFFPKARQTDILKSVTSMENPNDHPVFLCRYVSELFDPNTGKARAMEDNLGDMNLELVKNIHVSTTQCFVGCSKDFKNLGGDINIVFQGTAEFADYLTDLQGTMTPWEPFHDKGNAGSCASCQGSKACSCCLWLCAPDEAKRTKELHNESTPYVHLGFYNSFLLVRDEIEASIRPLIDAVVNKEDKNIRIVVTGHSLGGSLSILCTAWIIEWLRRTYPNETNSLPKNVRILSTSFAAPKVGNPAFADMVESDPAVRWEGDSHATVKTYRIVSMLDPVPNLPPKSMRFKHCYALVTLTTKGEMYFVKSKSVGRVDQTVAGVARLMEQGLSFLTFHDLFAYQDRVMAFALKQIGDYNKCFGPAHYDDVTRSKDFLETF